jgi:hypothetical protein
MFLSKRCDERVRHFTCKISATMEEDASLRRPEGTTVNCGTRKAAYETPIHPSLIARVPFGASSPAFDAVEARSECETLPQSRLSQAWIVCVDRVNLAAACDQLEPIIFEYLLDDPAFLDQVTVGIA